MVGLLVWYDCALSMVCYGGQEDRTETSDQRVNKYSNGSGQASNKPDTKTGACIRLSFSYTQCQPSTSTIYLVLKLLIANKLLD